MMVKINYSIGIEGKNLSTSRMNVTKHKEFDFFLSRFGLNTGNVSRIKRELKL